MKFCRVDAGESTATVSVSELVDGTPVDDPGFTPVVATSEEDLRVAIESARAYCIAENPPPDPTPAPPLSDALIEYAAETLPDGTVKIA
jgi:hypothetical protein